MYHACCLMLHTMKSLIISCLKRHIYIILTLLCALMCISCQKEDEVYSKKEKAIITVQVFDGINPYGNHEFRYVMLYENATKWSFVPCAEPTDWGLETGYEYNILAWKLWRRELMMDGSAFDYRFRRVLKKTKAEPLTMDDIAWGNW